MRILLSLLAIFTLSACSEQEPEVIWLQESSVWVHVEGTKGHFYIEDNYKVDESCDSNEVMVNGKCEVAIFADDVMNAGFTIAAIPTDMPGQFKLRVFQPQVVGDYQVDDGE